MIVEEQFNFSFKFMNFLVFKLCIALWFKWFRTFLYYYTCLPKLKTEGWRMKDCIWELPECEVTLGKWQQSLFPTKDGAELETWRYPQFSETIVLVTWTNHRRWSRHRQRLTNNPLLSADLNFKISAATSIRKVGRPLQWSAVQKFPHCNNSATAAK